MAIYIYCRRPSNSALLLRDAINANGPTCVRLRRPLVRLTRGDLWVNYGTAYEGPYADGVIRLNDVAPLGKRTQLLRLYQHGVTCPEVYDSPGTNRIGRSRNHQGGTDLLAGTGADYWTQKIDLLREFRIHVFSGKSIRAGLKVAGPNAHPWIRSRVAGWRLSYGRDCQSVIQPAYRDIAKRAVTALKLDFGAVDIGVATNGTPIVLEVNLAPGLDNASAAVYARHLIEAHNAQQ